MTMLSEVAIINYIRTNVCKSYTLAFVWHLVLIWTCTMSNIKLLLKVLIRTDSSSIIKTAFNSWLALITNNYDENDDS